MTEDDLAESLVPLAAELVGTVRDYGPEDVAAILARVPDGRHDALAVVLACMVDPDARPKQLLAWLELGPVPSRTFESPRHTPSARTTICPDCGDLIRVAHTPRHRRRHHAAVAS